jgi:V-type H+-transporting ATPase proteolipid subunit
MPIIMAGIVGIYGLVTAVIIAPNYQGQGLLALCWLCEPRRRFERRGCASGSRAMAEQPRLIMGVMLILIFGEVLGLYGFIISILQEGVLLNTSLTGRF